MFCASVRQIRTYEADMIILCCVTYIARLFIRSFRTHGYMLSWQISRLIILCRVTSIALLYQIGTHSRALRGYWHGSLDFSTSNILGFQIRCASQVFLSTSIVGLAPFLLDDVLISIEKKCNPGKTKKATHLFILQSSLATNL